jgi:hypothetical protein
MGLRCIEDYPGQTIGGDHGDAKFDHNLSAELQQAVQDHTKFDVYSYWCRWCGSRPVSHLSMVGLSAQVAWARISSR